MFTGIGRKAQAIWQSKRSRRSEEPQDDIQRENLDDSDGTDGERGFHMSSLLGDIRKNWAENQ